MPALVNSRLGSSCGTRDELATTRWPFDSKYLRNELLICFDVSICNGYFTSLVAASEWRPTRQKPQSPAAPDRRAAVAAPAVHEDGRGCRESSSRVSGRAFHP